MVALLLGWEPDAAGIPLAVAGAVLATVAFAGLGLLMAGHAPGRDDPGRWPTASTSCCCCSAAWSSPSTSCPSAVQTVAELLPAAALADIMIGALTPGGEIAARSWVVLVVWAVATPIAAVRWFRWE